MTGVECQSGTCQGLNQKTNLRIIGTYILDPMLRDMPPEELGNVGEMLSRIRRLDVSPSELVNFLEALMEKYRECGQSQVVCVCVCVCAVSYTHLTLPTS